MATTDVNITLARSARCGSRPRFTAEYRGVRWEFASRNAGTADDLRDEAMHHLARMAIQAGRGATTSPTRFESGHDYVELV